MRNIRMYSVMGLEDDIGFVVMQQEIEFLNCGVFGGGVVRARTWRMSLVNQEFKR
jgi:hypothetical protein